MKWFYGAAIFLVLMVSFAYCVINQQATLATVTEDVQVYMSKRETLKQQVRSDEELRDRGAALEKSWLDFKKAEGELKGLYGDKVSLEGECTRLSARRDELRQSIVALEEQESVVLGRVSEFANQTNSLGKAMERLRGERDSVMSDISAEYDAYEKAKTMRATEEDRYQKQKRFADEEAARAIREKTRADEAKHEADDAETRKATAQRAAVEEESIQRNRIEAVRNESDSTIRAHEKRAEAARRAAVAAEANAVAVEEKLSSLTEEVAKLETRRNELAGVQALLDEAKAKLAAENQRLGQARAKVEAQQIVAQVDSIREDVSRRLNDFSNKLNEFEKNHKAEAQQGGLK